ncbi:hypothetical protein HDG38_004167 [Paraburkholderia sp. WSM4177]|nr:hypothetical protein [Paraburkholderia sp. WSM4177]MBB5485984.1 hypothetical protein [Paraburkholderia sp. WSM4180]
MLKAQQVLLPIQTRPCPFRSQVEARLRTAKLGEIVWRRAADEIDFEMIGRKIRWTPAFEKARRAEQQMSPMLTERSPSLQRLRNKGDGKRMSRPSRAGRQSE